MSEDYLEADIDSAFDFGPWSALRYVLLAVIEDEGDIFADVPLILAYDLWEAMAEMNDDEAEVYLKALSNLQRGAKAGWD